MRYIGFGAALLFVATVWFANWLIGNYGIVPVGFGLSAPAGVYAAGLAFTLRDVVHRALGRRWVVAAILLGAALSYTVSSRFAVASAIAFIASEAADLAVYEPLQKRSLIAAVVTSNTVGAALFLWLAFGSLAFFSGQLIGKSWVTLAVLPLLIASRRLLSSGADLPATEGSDA